MADSYGLNADLEMIWEKTVKLSLADILFFPTEPCTINSEELNIWYVISKWEKNPT